MKALIDERKNAEKNLQIKTELLFSVSELIAHDFSAETVNDAGHCALDKAGDEIGIKIFTNFKIVFFIFF